MKNKIILLFVLVFAFLAILPEPSFGGIRYRKPNSRLIYYHPPNHRPYRPPRPRPRPIPRPIPPHPIPPRPVPPIDTTVSIIDPQLISVQDWFKSLLKTIKVKVDIGEPRGRPLKIVNPCRGIIGYNNNEYDRGYKVGMELLAFAHYIPSSFASVAHPDSSLCFRKGFSDALSLKFPWNAPNSQIFTNISKIIDSDRDKGYRAGYNAAYYEETRFQGKSYWYEKGFEEGYRDYQIIRIKRDMKSLNEIIKRQDKKGR